MRRCSSLLLRPSCRCPRVGEGYGPCFRNIQRCGGTYCSAHVATTNVHQRQPFQGSLYRKAPAGRPVLEEDINVQYNDLRRRVLARLPSRFQAGEASHERNDLDSVANAQALGQLLIEGDHNAQRKHDLLYDLAVHRGQWKAVVWIVQRILETSRHKAVPGNELSRLVEQDSNLPSLKFLTENPLDYRSLIDAEKKVSPSINSLIGPQNPISEARAEHQVLGSVWRSLGLMTLACVRDVSISNGSVKPELLEILALFHHHGFMPESVYTYVPSDRPDIIEQPATLYLLSSRIMVALSDAAWRGREAAVLQSPEKDGVLGITRLEKLGRSVRANIEAVKPAMWLELILWSCLHGGWVHPGIDILMAVCRENDPAWSPISWRKTLKDYLGIHLMEEVNWNELIADFSLSRKTAYDPEMVQIDHTVSSELVNAFVEALLDSTGPQDLPAGRVFRILETFRSFLQRSGLNLHSGTWDATVLRMVENYTALVDRTDMMDEFVRLSPTMGEELTSQDEQRKPAYLLDGNAALLGLLHRALIKQIDAGSLTRTLRIFKLIRKCVDDAKQRSIEDFFRSRLLNSDPDESLSKTDGIFSFNGVEHPNFDHQIPMTTMSALFDLITQQGAHDLGKALIYERDLDGGLLEKVDFGHPRLAPSLIRFATATGDHGLVAKVVQARDLYIAEKENRTLHFDPVMSSILSELFVTKQWQNARAVLGHIQRNLQLEADSHCLAVLGSMILKMEHAVSSDDSSNDVQQAWELLEDMTCGEFAPVMRSQRKLASQQLNILTVLEMLDSKYPDLSLPPSRQIARSAPDVLSFNAILDAVATTRGSAAARTLLETFAPQLVPDSFSEENDLIGTSSRSFQSDASRPPPEKPFNITTPGGQSMTILRSVRPNVTSFVIVLKISLTELKDRHNRHSTDPLTYLDNSTRDLIAWAVRNMLETRHVGTTLNAQDVYEELHRLVVELGIETLQADITSIIAQR